MMPNLTIRVPEGLRARQHELRQLTLDQLQMFADAHGYDLRLDFVKRATPTRRTAR